MKKKLLLLATLFLLLCPDAKAQTKNDYGLPEKIPDGNILHCFSWPMKNIIEELPNIAASGFGAIQISPLQRPDIDEGRKWYEIYLPYDYHVMNSPGMGSKDDLKKLCAEADKYGIKIVVDVVLNHVNKTEPYYNPWFKDDSHQRYRYWGSEGRSIDWDSRESITHDPLGDYVELNTENSEVVAKAKAYIEELKACGVKGIRFDAAKHIEIEGDCSHNPTFWPTITSVKDLWFYGEIVGQAVNGSDAQISKYNALGIWVPDPNYTRNAADKNEGVPTASGGDRDGRTQGKLVYYGESHDDYSNDEWSEKLTQGVVDRAYCAYACRNTQTALYYSRPRARGKDDIKITKGSTAFMGKHIAEVNKFRNAMVGKRDYFSKNDGNNACSITREGGGAVIIMKGSGSVGVANGGGYCPAGTYIDRVSGGTFTVTSSGINGTVGPSGVAVIYKDENYKATPAPAKVTITGSKKYNVAFADDFMKDNNLRGDNYIHYWKSGNTSDGTKWPGVPMERACGSDGKYYWCYNVPEGYDMVIFNNGDPADRPQEGTNKPTKMQSSDLKLVSDYIMNNGGATITPVEFTVGSFPEEPLTIDRTVTIKGDYNVAFSGNFDYIHTWSAPNEEWPGKVMKTVTGSDGKTYRVFKVEDGRTNVVFNNGGNGEQTGNLTYSGNFIMCESGATEIPVKFIGGGDDPEPEKPVMSATPESGTTFTDVLSVTLTASPDATIHYTLDGTEPTTSSTQYSSVITLTATTTIKAFGVTSEGVEGDVATFAYTKKEDPEDPDIPDIPGEVAEPAAIPVVWPTGNYCYFYNNDNWSKVNLHWSDSSGKWTAWPGNEIKDQFAGKYFYSNPTTKPSVLVFNAGQGPDQTSNINFVNGATYYPDGGHIGGDDKLSSNPDKLYVLGSLKDHSWEPDYGGVEMTKLDKGIYVAYNVPLTDGSDAYFSFTSAVADSWVDLNSKATRFGASSENFPISINTPTHITEYAGSKDYVGSCKSWKGAAGNYDVVVDLYDMTVTLLEPQDAPSVEALQLVEVQKTTADDAISAYDYLTYPAKDSKAYGVIVDGGNISATQINVTDAIYEQSRNVLFSDNVLVTTTFNGTDAYNLEPQTASIGTKMSDGKFRGIVKLTSAEAKTIGSKVNYYYPLRQGVEVKVPMQTGAGSSSVQLTVPEPQLIHSGISVTPGEQPATFTYGDMEFSARYHTVKSAAEIDVPMTSGLKKLANTIYSVTVNGSPLEGTIYEGNTLSPEYFLSEEFAAPSVMLSYSDNTPGSWDTTAKTADRIGMTFDAPAVNNCKVKSCAVFYTTVGKEKHLLEVDGFVLDAGTSANTLTAYSGDEALVSHTLAHEADGDWYLVEFYNGGEKIASAIVEGADGEREFTVTRDYGQWYDGQIESVLAGPFHKRITEAKVSTLYPFALTTRSGATESPRRVPGSNVSGQIVESEAASVTDIDNPEIVTGIESVSHECIGEVEYFNMQGVRVSRPDVPGIYLRRSADGRVSKRVIR